MLRTAAGYRIHSGGDMMGCGLTAWGSAVPPPIDRDKAWADSEGQKSSDLVDAQRRYNESVAASIHSLAREANYG